jgi:tRNA-dihydrouridine synthase B
MPPVLTIGSLQIPMPAIQAALSGFSDGPMRMVARRFGAAFAMAEVVLDEHVVLKGRLRGLLLSQGTNWVDPAGVAGRQ